MTENDLQNRKNPCFDENKIIDYVLVYKEEETNNNYFKIKSKRENYLKNLQAAGLELRLHVSFFKFLYLWWKNKFDLKAPKEMNDKKLSSFENEDDKNRKIVYILVHTPLEKLYEAAEKTRFKVPIQVNIL